MACDRCHAPCKLMLKVTCPQLFYLTKKKQCLRFSDIPCLGVMLRRYQFKSESVEHKYACQVTEILHWKNNLPCGVYPTHPQGADALWHCSDITPLHFVGIALKLQHHVFEVFQILMGLCFTRIKRFENDPNIKASARSEEREARLAR